MHHVYNYTNQRTGQQYIGCTCEPPKREYVHTYRATRDFTRNEPLYQNMRKHGVENFKMTIIKSFTLREDALAYERKMIQKLQPELNVHHRYKG